MSRHLFAQFLDDFLGHLARSPEVLWFQRDSRHARMPAAAVLLREAGKIILGSVGIPWVRPEGNFGANRRYQNAYGIACLGIKHVRDEFVISFYVQITQIKENDAIANIHPLAQQLDGLVMPLQQWLKM